MSKFQFKIEQKDELIKYCGSVVFTAMKNADPVKDRYVMVIDVENSPWMDKDLIKSLIPIFGNYFPDLLHKQFIIKAGFLIKGLWNVVYNFLHPVTQKKITLIGTNKTEIFNLFRTEMDLDEIPV